MRVFFDTNVLISAFTTSGFCLDVVRLAVDDYIFITGEVVLTELERVLKTRFAMPDKIIQRYIHMLRKQTIVPKPAKPADAPIDDPDDAWVLASALEAKANFLVTGDKDLLKIKDKADITIIDPRGFFDMIKGK